MIIVSAACFWMALGFLAWALHDHDEKQRFGFDEKPAYWLLMPMLLLGLPGLIGALIATRLHRDQIRYKKGYANLLVDGRKVNVPGLLDDTLGWRFWLWDGERLWSPYQRARWEGPELRCENWSDDEAVRGFQGIHAHRAPTDWTERDLMCGAAGGAFMDAYIMWGQSMPPRICWVVHGIAERYGRFVLGKEGWRAEWAVIRKLLAPSPAVGLALESAYPEVEVVYGHR